MWRKLIIEGVAQQTKPRNKHFLPNLSKSDDKKRGQPIGEEQNCQHFEPLNKKDRIHTEDWESQLDLGELAETVNNFEN